MSLAAFGLLSLLEKRITEIHTAAARGSASVGAAKIVVITHFSGGILLRNLLLTKPEISSRIFAWVASATPWQGFSFLFSDNMWPLTVTKKADSVTLPSYFADKDFLIGLSKESLTTLYATPAAREMKDARISDEDFETQSEIESTAIAILNGGIVEDGAFASVSPLSPPFWRYTPPPLFPVLHVSSNAYTPPGWDTFPQVLLPKEGVHRILSKPDALQGISNLLGLPRLAAAASLGSAIRGNTPAPRTPAEDSREPMQPLLSASADKTGAAPPATVATRHPIILVPGIAGSQLRMRDKKTGIDTGVWLRGIASEKYVENFLWGYYDSSSKLFKPFNDRVQVYARFGSDGLECLDTLMSDMAGIQPLFAKRIVYFRRLIRYLTKKHGFTPGVDLFGLPYDWRQHLCLSAFQLHGLIVRAFHTNGGKKVDIIAHSMGGCLVMAYFRQFSHVWQKYVHRLVSIGVPYGGAGGCLVAAPLWGYTLKFEMFNPTVFKQIEMCAPSLGYMQPSLAAEGPSVFLRYSQPGECEETAPSMLQFDDEVLEPPTTVSPARADHKAPLKRKKVSLRDMCPISQAPRRSHAKDLSKVELRHIPPLAKVLLKRFAHLPEQELDILRCVLSDPDWREDKTFIKRARLTLRSHRRYASSVGHRLHFTMGCQGWGNPEQLANFSSHERDASHNTSASFGHSREPSFERSSRRASWKRNSWSVHERRNSSKELKTQLDSLAEANPFNFPEPGICIASPSLSKLDSECPPSVITFSDDSDSCTADGTVAGPWHCYSYSELPSTIRLKYQSEPPPPTSSTPSTFPPLTFSISAAEEPMKSAVLTTVRQILSVRAGDGTRPWLSSIGIDPQLLAESGARALIDQAIEEDAHDKEQGGYGHFEPSAGHIEILASEDSSMSLSLDKKIPDDDREPLVKHAFLDFLDVIYKPDTLARALFEHSVPKWDHIMESVCRHILLPVEKGPGGLIDGSRLKLLEMEQRETISPFAIPRSPPAQKNKVSSKVVRLSTMFTEDSFPKVVSTSHLEDMDSREACEAAHVPPPPNMLRDAPFDQSSGDEIDISLSLEPPESSVSSESQPPSDALQERCDTISSSCDGTKRAHSTSTEISITPEKLERPFLFFSIVGAKVPTQFHTYYNKVFSTPSDVPLSKPEFVEVTGDATVPLISALSDPFPDWYVGARVIIDNATHFGLLQLPETWEYITEFLGLDKL
eukprot:gnl/Chilomastix_cuspidata/1233.p1 GENE.gnl/Chilomastix_cuspidata/1233~~gnl/Chilomastix_cuspidata/1233.p1  ORF type:complete len:1330 (-),score=250.62 gnl/Chilomastix_cuspidata/1233:23-3652(-)